MNSEEAKLFLAARRLDGQDDDDPRIAEALEQARRDPKLLAWYNGQREFDAGICEKLEQVAVPSELAGQILADHRTRRGQRTQRAVTALAIAASMVLLLTLGFWNFWPAKRPKTELAAMRADMTKFLARFPALDLTTDQWPEIARWLSQKTALEGVELPSAVRKFPGLGCREILWRGKSLLLVCFVAQGEVVHLLVFPKAELGDPSITDSTAFAVENGWSTASWSQAGVVYCMMTKGSMDFLKGMLAGSDRI